MKKYSKYILIIIALFISSILSAQNRKLGCNQISIRKTVLNKTRNTFDYSFIYKKNETCFEVYRKKVKDFSTEIEFSFSYSDSIVKYCCYVIYDQVTGISKNIIFDEKEGNFYLTDSYDLKALGDEPVKNSVDFNGKTIKVKSVAQSKVLYYTINLNKLSLRQMTCSN